MFTVLNMMNKWGSRTNYKKLFSEEVQPPSQLPISGLKLCIYTHITQRDPPMSIHYAP